MSVVEVIGVYVGIPVLVVGILAILTVGIHHRRGTVVYEPGQPWNEPDQFWAGDVPVAAAPSADRVGTRIGGASGSW